MTWNEEDHPREPAGTSEGGQFTSKAGLAAWKAAGLGVPYGAKTFDEYRKKLIKAVTEAAEKNKTDNLFDVSWDYYYREADSRFLKQVPKIQIAAEENNMTTEEYIEEVQEHYREELHYSNVYMRITNANLKRALQDGEFKNTFMTGKTKAGYSRNKFTYQQYEKIRTTGERITLGIDEGVSDEFRPIYGYWSQHPNAKLTSDDRGWDSLEQYGSIAVKFNKDAIADSLTWTSEDSLDSRWYIRSSDWRNPSAFSSSKFMIDPGNFRIFEDTPDSGWNYWEAQIFDRSISNVEEVIFYLEDDTSKVQAATIKLLQKAGIPWRTVKN